MRAELASHNEWMSAYGALQEWRRRSRVFVDDCEGSTRKSLIRFVSRFFSFFLFLFLGAKHPILTVACVCAVMRVRVGAAVAMACPSDVRIYDGRLHQEDIAFLSTIVPPLRTARGSAPCDPVCHSYD